MHGLEMFDVQGVGTQGGSLRIYAGHPPLVFDANDSIKTLLAQEKNQGLYDVTTFKNFGAAVKQMKNNFVAVLADLKKQHKKIVGYGAAAKATTLLGYCSINKNTIDYIVDDSPHKQGKYMPGTHIPIVSTDHLKKKPAGLCCLVRLELRRFNNGKRIMA